MSYLHTFQWKFGHIKYPSGSNPKATVSTSGCGPCSALMILENMTDQRYGMRDWINWVIGTGARVNGGTGMATLSKACFPHKYYHITEKGKGYLGSLKADWDDFSKMVNDILRGEEIE